MTIDQKLTRTTLCNAGLGYKMHLGFFKTFMSTVCKVLFIMMLNKIYYVFTDFVTFAAGLGFFTQQMNGQFLKNQ